MSGIVGWTNWIGVVAEDVARQRAFYRDVLGLREIHAGSDFVWFDLGWPTLLEVVAFDSGRPQREKRGYLIGLSTGDIASTFERLRERGVDLVTEILGGPESAGWWAYFRDAEGNLFEISQRAGPPWPDHAGGSSQALVGAPAWTGMIARDFDGTSAWVAKTFGFRPLARSDWWAWFDLGWPNLFEVIKRDPARRQYAEPGWGVAFAVGDIEPARDELTRRGARALHPTEGGGEFAGYWCHFLDAEDNVFAITQRLGPPWPAVQKES